VERRGTGGGTYSFIPFAQVIDVLIRNGDERISADEVYDSGDTLEEGLLSRG